MLRSAAEITFQDTWNLRTLARPGIHSDKTGIPTRLRLMHCSPRKANFAVRICHLSHLKSAADLAFLFSFFLRRDPPLRFDNGRSGLTTGFGIAWLQAPSLRRF